MCSDYYDECHTSVGCAVLCVVDYKYCHNSINIGDIRDVSAYLSTTDITIYQGIYGI